MKKPLVSILVPVWNREKYIAETLKSALAQTITDLEVVVVDNASTDGTWDTICQIAKSDSRVRPFKNQSNVGPIRNWQRTLDEAQGTYGKFIWSDDLITPDFLEKTIPKLEDDVGFVWTAATIFSSDDGNQTLAYSEDLGSSWTSEQFIRRTFAIEPGPTIPVSPGCALLRMGDLRETLQIGIPNRIGSDFAMHGIGNDQLILLLTAAKYKRVAHIPEPLSMFRVHPGSISTYSGSGKCLLMYQVNLGVFLDGPGKHYFSDSEIARFNANSELLIVRYNGGQYGIKSWRDFHAPNTPEGTVDTKFLLTHLEDALSTRLKDKQSNGHEFSVCLSDETAIGLLQALSESKVRSNRLRAELDESKEYCKILQHRLLSLINGWTKFKWKLLPWTKPFWRHHPLKK